MKTCLGEAVGGNNLLFSLIKSISNLKRIKAFTCMLVCVLTSFCIQLISRVEKQKSTID